jgi:aspartyl-tRNA(Asn)/glutamyl-tRNA(Gln) amidotransferase subunit A
MPLSWSLDHIGPLARSAEDLALLLGVIAGRDPNDPTTSLRPVPDFRQSLGRSVRGLRVALAGEGMDTEIDPAMTAAVEQAAATLADLGVAVERRSVPSFARCNALRRVIMLAEAAAIHRERLVAARERCNPQTVGRMEPGFAIPAVDHQRALAARAALLEEFCATVLNGADLLALPTSPVPTPEIAATDTGGDARFTAVANRLGALVGPFNYLGLPALSLPAGFDAAGMPLGLQLVARPFAEALLLQVAHALEAATGFSARRPPQRS